MDNKNKPRVGVGVMILRDDKVLLGHRHEDAEKASSELRGEGTWTMPGGKLDFQELLIDGAIREVFEETGIKLRNEDLRVLCIQDDIIPDKHFVTVGFLCQNFMGEPRVMEPDEITEWSWFGLDGLPQKVFPPSGKMIKAFLNNKVY